MNFGLPQLKSNYRAFGKSIALYCIVDDLLKALHHYEDQKARVADSEVIATAFVAALYVGGHPENACPFMKRKG